MPVILAPNNHDLWLDSGTTDTKVISELLKPFDAIASRESRVNQVQNDNQACAAPVEVAAAQPGLF